MRKDPAADRLNDVVTALEGVVETLESIYVIELNGQSPSIDRLSSAEYRVLRTISEDALVLLSMSKLIAERVNASKE